MIVDLQPSGASCWTVCQASPGFLARNAHRLPKDNGSSYSREGTLAHELASQCLLVGYDIGFFDDRSMALHVKDYVELIQGWASVPGSTLVVEYPVPLFYSPDKRTGTRDACVVALDCSWIKIGDLKYGAGVSVQAIKNKQLSIYALSTIDDLERSGLYAFEPTTMVTLMIWQPRIIGEEAKREWTITLAELREFCFEIGWIANTIDDNPHSPELVFAPSDKTCQFCDATPICEARASWLLGGLDVGADVAIREGKKLFLPPPEVLSIEHLTRIVAIAPELQTWLNKCAAYGAAMLHDGISFPGFKLVKGRANRKWADESVAREYLEATMGKELIYTSPELRSPAQIEEEAKHLTYLDDHENFWEELASLIVKPEGKVNMTREDDDRPAIDANPASVFEDLDQTTGMILNH